MTLPISTQDSTEYDVVRIKQILIRSKEDKKEINQEKINSIENVAKELDIHIDNITDNYLDALLSVIDKNTHNENILFSTPTEKSESIINPIFIDKEERISRLVYTNKINVKLNKTMYSFTYIVEIRNIDSNTYELFKDFSDLSFLRMLLDYFFVDYFEDNKGKYLTLDNEEKIGRKYNEDSTQFVRRITRLFFGKLQVILQNNYSINKVNISALENAGNQYYINNLLEKIDDISTRTYERNNPFGSIVMLNTNVLQKNTDIITYAIKFHEDDRVPLEDSKRIRKLLELTNNDNDLCLITDYEGVYGLGKINWNELRDCLVYKIEFRGLSSFNVQLLSTVEKYTNNGSVTIENGKKVYKTQKTLEIVSRKLLNVAFKTPSIGDDGYTSDKFKRIMMNQFSFDDDNKLKNEIDRLELIVSEAKEQKHGTMVVITDYETAVSELKTLKKQSTLIDRTIIEPEYVKYITSIDGAIYFDTFGYCHAIGVILDGIAREDLGDSSRGARYNSAFRYLQKLKETDKNCVIAIISEDGIVDIIPDIDNEEKLYTLFNQIIDLITEDSTEHLEELEEQIKTYKNIDYHMYFKIAEAFNVKKEYNKVIEYILLGISMSKNSYIVPKYYRYLADAYFYLARSKKKSDPSYQENYVEAVKVYSQYIDNSKEEDIIHHDYNHRAIAVKILGDLESKKNIKFIKYKRALSDYTKAIDMQPKSHVLYSNRANLYERMNMLQEALSDLILAEILAHQQDYIDRIMNMLESNGNLFEECLKVYSRHTKKEKDSELAKLFKDYLEKLELANPEAAASLEETYFRN